ncbi:hypothetical protein BGI41_02970 [Methanobrevibacter sp. 87.7]|uniref:right-handed parallel beta-helix repeat-containing protein n=1 Tax=Methanobrevibacter sp. 87.7 TaxID=387957 RepID=UPI000B50D0A3|nr:right-handed parallel beta-helix repeat-containing protein [Methanobrevibacter sp. 87.7]OWT33334.1 hypothetical protein BGI41_02970 [Methanobrevibacter sp. 87.7]
MNNLKTMLIISIIAFSMIIIPCSFAADPNIGLHDNSIGVDDISTNSNIFYVSNEDIKSSNALNDNYNLGDSNSDHDIYVATDGSDDDGDGSESSPYASISKAINSSSKSDMYNINVKNGTYVISSQLNIENKNVIGLGGVIFDLNNRANGFYATGVVSFSNIKFINGNGSKSYGYSPIKSSSTSGELLKITNCTFENCYGNYAGAVTTYYSGYANLIVSNSTFRNCHSTSYGGAISVSSSKTANITNCIFEDCSANYGGSIAFVNTNGGSIVNNCLFINSVANNNQSIIYSKGLENLEFNFWGNNSKPDAYVIGSKNNVNKWVVLNLITDTSFITLGNQIPFNYDFTKYTDGVNFIALENSMPNLSFTVNSKLGEFDNVDLLTANGVASNVYTPKTTGDESISLNIKNNTVVKYDFPVFTSSDSFIFVSDVGNDKTGDGSNQNPYKTIQYALSKVSNVKNSIFIKKGKYNENNLEISKNVTIIGEDIDSTIINGTNTGRIFIIDGNINVVLKSLTLTDGTPDYDSDDFTVGGKGGAIYVDSGNLTLDNIIISNSKSAAGGAVAIFSGPSGSLKVINSQFINNSIDQDAYDSYYFDTLGGGAIYSESSNFITENSTFINNSNPADENNYAGAIFLANNGIINNCTFINNSVNGYGGAISVEAYTSSNVIITNNIFCNNSAKIGGAIYSDLSKLTTIKNNTFISNKATKEGGSISIYSLTNYAIIEDNIFNESNAINGRYVSIKYANVLFNNNIINDTNPKTNVIYLNNGKINGNLTFISNKTITVLHGSNVNFTALFTDNMRNPITNANITFTLNGEVIGNAITDANGIATLNYKVGDSLEDYVLSGTLKGNEGNVTVLNGTVKVSKYYWFIGEQGYFTLQDAVDGSVEGDTIIGLPGTYFFNKEIAIGDRMKKIYKNVTIKANKLGDITLVGVNTTLFNVAAKYYGAYDHRPSLLNLENMIVENCSSEYAGAIYNDAYLCLNNCIFRNNFATNKEVSSKWHGGVILNWKSMVINNCTFENNHATVGGAIYTESLEGNVTIKNTNFINNYATAEGGAVYAGNGLHVFENCKFLSNIASVGGAICAATDTIVNNTEFISNTADIAGGAVYATNGNFTANNISVIKSSSKYGGALYLLPGITYYTTYENGNYYQEVDLEIFNITNSYFEKNHADIDGGVIFEGYNKVSTGFIDNCTFVNNSALGNGSVLSNYMGNATINNSRFINNTGVNGTLYNKGNIVEDILGPIQYSGNMFIYNSEFINNTAVIGGALLNNDPLSIAVIKDSKFINQSATDYGGVILNNGFVNLTGNLMSNCSSNVGNYIYNNGTIALVYLNFLNNETVEVKTYVSKIVLLNATVTDDMGNPITGQYLVFNVNGTKTAKVYVDEGLATINYTIPNNGEYLVSGVYDTSDLSIKTGVISTVEKITSHFVYGNNSINVAEDYVIKLLDGGNNPLVGKVVNITIVSDKNTVSENYITDENGSIVIKYLLSGNYLIFGNYSGDENTVGSNFTTNLSVNKFKTNIDITYNNKSITAQLTSNGKPLVSNNLRVSLLKSSVIVYNLITDSEGKIYLNNLPGGNYLITVSFDGTEMYESSSNSLNVNVPKTKIVITAKDMVQKAVDFYNGERGAYFNVSVKDEYGNPLANKNVNIGFNGVAYNVITDANGIARLQINLAWANVYTFAVAVLSDDEYEGSFVVSKITITKKPTTLVVPKKTYSLNTKTKTITVTLKGDKAISPGFVPGVNKVVKVTVNGKTYSAKTNSKGVATVKVSVNKRGTYVVTTSFAGDGTFAAKTVKSTLVIK